MNKAIGIQLVIYSLLFAGLSYLSHILAPGIARITLITGLTGGGVCLLLGFRALSGHQGKVLPVLTLIPVCYFFLSQTFLSWTGGQGEVTGQRSAASVITVLMFLSLGMLMRIAWAGSFDTGTPTRQVSDEETKTQFAEKSTFQTNAAKLR